MEVLRQRQVYCTSGWPQAVADRSVPDGAQLEPVHGVPVRVDPLEFSKAGVPARLSRHQVGPLVACAVADAGRIANIRYASDGWRIGGPTRDDDDRGDSPRTEASPDEPLHVLQGGQVVDHVGRKNVRPIDGSRPIAISQIEWIYDLIPSSIANMQRRIR